MKIYGCLFAAFMFVFSLSAQSGLVGNWSGKAVKNGQPMGFELQIKDNGTFTMTYGKAYDLNPNELSFRGTWTSTKGKLTFKGSDEELQLMRVAKDMKGRKSGFLLEFRQSKKRIIYRSVSGTPGFFGWDEGVAAIVVNHEEQW